MHGPINVKSPNNTSKWRMGFNSSIKRVKLCADSLFYETTLCPFILIHPALLNCPEIDTKYEVKQIMTFTNP